MRQLIRALRHGRDLRHLPVEWPGVQRVRVELRWPGGSADVSAEHTPVSLVPLLIGIRLPANAPRDGLQLHFVDNESGYTLGRMHLKHAGTLDVRSLHLQLFAPTKTENYCASPVVTWWRSMLARRHADRAEQRGERLKMSGEDLIALNLYYTVHRPVYLVGVRHEAEQNFFPMDLVSTIGGREVLALRSTSPSVETIRASGRLTMSVAPADAVEQVYALGKHHRTGSIDLSVLPFAVDEALDGLPALAGGASRRLVRVDEVATVGSHTVFVGETIRREDAPSKQLAHVSGMYHEWRAAQAR